MSLLSQLGLGNFTQSGLQQPSLLTQGQILSSACQSQFNTAYQSQSTQLTQSQIASLGTSAVIMVERTWQWMIAGRVLSFDEFVDELFPEDCAERTYIILKFKGIENDTSNKD